MEPLAGKSLMVQPVEAASTAFTSRSASSNATETRFQMARFSLGLVAPGGRETHAGRVPLFLALRQEAC